ncbi:MAG: 8-amino-7-oxononanoate synthase [Gammaproteobacteria bacterium]
MQALLNGEGPGWQSELNAIRQQGLFRTRKEIVSPQGAVVTVAGREVVNFCSNDYLGLANHRGLVRAMGRALNHFGVGSGASQLVCGRSIAHAALEEALARATGRERALLFSSGYQANLAVATTLCPGRNDIIVADRLSHASSIDGARLSRARFRRYAHIDVHALEKQLEKGGDHRKLVLTDGVFSMDGDIAPVGDIAARCRRSGACLAVDDAHGFGVLGERGRGTLELLGLNEQQVPVLIGTFGKALGVFGAFVAGPDAIIELLIQRARPYIYTTALPPAIAVTVKEALRLLDDEAWRRERLRSLITYFRGGAARLGLALPGSETPIQPLIIGTATAAVELSEKLFQKGLFITAIRPPTVPANSARLRITITAAHTESQIDRLLETLSQLLDGAEVY